MKKLVLVLLLALAVCVSAQTISVKFEFPPHPEGSWEWVSADYQAEYGNEETYNEHASAWHWGRDWDASSEWKNWAEQIVVNIYEDGELIGSNQFQRHQNTESDLTELANEATELYTQLNAQEVVVNDLYDRIGTAMNDDQYQDKAYSQLTEDLVEDKKIYDEILYQVEVKMDEVRTDEGSGNLGWWYYN